jgi:membrane peptidoglycan carboxypeptidase
MDADRFDQFCRSFGNRTSRRRAVKQLGGGGLVAAALAGFGLTRAQSSAQDDSEVCTLDLVAAVHLGRDQNRPLDGENRGNLRGQLRFTVGAQGRLVDGVLQYGDDSEVDVTGQVAGLAITMRIAIPEVGTLVLIGAGERALRSCEGAVDGLITGPSPGSLGDWHAVAARAGETPTAGTATQTAAAAATMTATVGTNPNPGQTPIKPPAQTATTASNRPPTRIPTLPSGLTPTHQTNEPPTEPPPTEPPPPPPTEVPTEPPPPPTEEPTEVLCVGSGLPCTLGLIECCSGNCEPDLILPDVGLCA